MTRETAMRILVYAALAVGVFVFAWRALGAEAELKIERRSTNNVVYVSGGDTNTQYWIQESDNHTVVSTWSNWKRVYPVERFADPEEGKQPVFSVTAPPGTAAARPQRFFALGDLVTAVRDRETEWLYRLGELPGL